MKPIELYNRIPESITNNMNFLVSECTTHIPEIECFYFTDEVINKNTKVLIKIYKDFYFDHRRLWRLASVWFDNKPIMIIQNAGREGDDHSNKYITDKDGYIDMIKYIISLDPKELNLSDVCVDINDDIKALDEFYSHRLDGEFIKK